MSNEEEQHEVDLKLFIKAVIEQFRKMNARLDDRNPDITLSPLEDD